VRAGHGCRPRRGAHAGNSVTEEDVALLHQCVLASACDDDDIGCIDGGYIRLIASGDN
jgi:hypothetical protein